MKNCAYATLIFVSVAFLAGRLDDLTFVLCSLILFITFFLHDMFGDKNE